MKLILLISIISLVSSQEYEDDWAVEDGYELSDNSGDEPISSTTTHQPVVIVKETNNGVIGAVLGGVSIGTGIICGLVLLGRRFCKKTTKEKNDRDLDNYETNEKEIGNKKDFDLDYDYYGIMQKRYNYQETSSSV